MKKVIWMTMIGMLFFAVPAMAADGHEASAGDGYQSIFLDNGGAAVLGACVGAGLVVMGGAAGIGRVGGSGVEAMARQPEAAGSINGLALITAAMVEGATLFAVVVCLLGVLGAADM